MYFLIASSQDAVGMSYGWAAAKMLIAMVVIIGLAFATIRYLLPHLNVVKRNKSSLIQVLDVQPIAQRKAVYLLKIDNKKLAVGVSEHNMTKLCEWDVTK